MQIYQIKCSLVASVPLKADISKGSESARAKMML